MWGTLQVRMAKNVKECMEVLTWDLSETGISVQWKKHQSSKSGSQVLLICIPNVFNREGFEEEVCY
jgi:hypothetical protein